MPLGPFIRDAAGAESVTVEDGNLLTGGAIQENRALTVTIRGGEFPFKKILVQKGFPWLKTDNL